MLPRVKEVQNAIKQWRKLAARWMRMQTDAYQIRGKRDIRIPTQQAKVEKPQTLMGMDCYCCRSNYIG